jgi:hypothetical protein
MIRNLEREFLIDCDFLTVGWYLDMFIHVGRSPEADLLNRDVAAANFQL